MESDRDTSNSLAKFKRKDSSLCILISNNLMVWYVDFSKYRTCNLLALVKAYLHPFGQKLSEYLRPASAPVPMLVIKVSGTTN